MNDLLHLFHEWLFPIAWWSFAAYWLISALWARRTKVAEAWLPRILHFVIGTCAILILAFHNYFPDSVDWQLWPHSELTFWLGGIVTLAGLGFAVWARVHLGKYWSGAITLKEGHRLIRSGPYQIVRNPIYNGIITGVAGTAIALGKISGFVAVAIIFAVYSWKIRREEKLLAGEFGEEFAAYCREVPALVPFLPRKS